MKVCVLSDINVEKAIQNSEGLLLLEMYSPVSGICIIMRPLINRLKKKYNKSLRHCRLDISDSPVFSRDYNIKNSTYLLLFSKNQLVERLEGLVPYVSLERLIIQYMDSEIK
jgi:thioredoxin-like negative regulator of GroEL